MKKIGLLVLVLVVLIGGYSVIKSNFSSTASSPTPTPSASSSSSATQATGSAIAIKGYAFSPVNLTVKMGTTVTWTNKDQARHTITADQVSADAPASAFFGQNESYSFTFNKPGTYTYHCEPHPFMKGTVTVTQ